MEYAGSGQPARATESTQLLWGLCLAGSAPRRTRVKLDLRLGQGASTNTPYWERWREGAAAAARSHERRDSHSEPTTERTARCSVDPLAGTSVVDGLEGSRGALVEDALGLEALVLVVTVGGHAGTELAEVVGAELLEDILAGGALILAGEAARAVSLRWGTYKMTRSSTRVDFLLVPPKLCTMFSIGILTVSFIIIVRGSPLL